MANHKLKVSTKVTLVEIFEIEADTPEEAIRLYEEELAGTLQTDNFWTECYYEGDDGKIEVVNEKL